MEIKKCNIKEVLPLRMSVLRPGRPMEEGIFPGDEDETTFHLGLFEENNLISIASFYKENKEGYEGEGYRLRSMATNPEYQGKGFGKRILDAGIRVLKENNIDYLWCNARTSATGFYRTFGFDVISPEFDIPHIGPHYEMKIDLK